MMKLLGSTEKRIAKDKNGKNVPYLEITEVILVHFNMINNYYQHNFRVLYTFISDKSFDQLLDISPKKNKYFLKTFDSEF